MQKRKKKGHLAAKEENSPVPKLPLESVINIIKYLLSITKHLYIQGKKESNIFKNKNVNISYHIHLDFSSFFGTSVLKWRNWVKFKNKTTYNIAALSIQKELEGENIKYASLQYFLLLLGNGNKQISGITKFFRHPTHQNANNLTFYNCIFSNIWDFSWVNSFQSIRISLTCEGGLKKCHHLKVITMEFQM